MEKITKYKFSLLLILLFFIPVSLSASAQDALVSIDFTNAPLSKVLNEIGRQTSLSVVYNSKDINPDRIISIKANQEKLVSVMGRILRNTNAAFSVKDKHLVLFTNESESEKSVPQQNKRIIKGVVSDEKGEPLIGVSVIIKGTTMGTITDMDGNYSIDVPEANGVLEFSYIGYQKVDFPIAGRTSYNVVMKEDSQVLGEVVITAMGIERKAESLTYATQKVGGKELTRAKDVNFVNSLQGKSAGLTITPNSSGAGGGSSKIILRGQSSILGNNQPLIVLDGIPMSNGMSSQTNEVVMGTSRDGGDILSTINPDDIANISILKGPNAAALYGSAANNGVIIITTKGGREGKIRIDVSSNTTFETPLMYPKQQKEFAPSIVGNTINYDGWGKRVSDLTDDELATYPYLTRSPRDNAKDFFNIGQTYNNSVAVSGGTEHSNSYFSYGNTVQKGLISNNKFARHNLLLKENFNAFNGRLKLDFSLNYITQKTNNRPVIGKAKSLLPGLYSTPSAVDLRYFDQNRSHIALPDDDLVLNGGDGNGNSHLIGESVQTFPWLNQAWINNPYYMLDAVDDEAVKHRIMTSLAVKVDLYKGLSAQARVSLDQRIDDNVKIEYASIRGANNQSIASNYWSSKGNHREIYSDYLLTYNKQIKDISLSVTAGTSFKRIKTRNVSLGKFNDSTYVKPNIPYPNTSWNGTMNPDNAGGILTGNEGRSTYWESAIFATAQVGFWNKGYIDVSFRNDWAKPFQQFAAKGKYKSFPYYSLGGNLLLKELIPLDMPKVNSLKLRASYSVVGNSIPDKFYYAQTLNPLTGKISTRPPSFDNPKPETTKAIEVGVDGILFDNKLDFDFTLYQTIMENQFLEYSTPGGEKKPVNSGKVRNRGIEFTTNYHMTFAKNFKWSTGINLAYNDNRILKTVNIKGEDVEVNIGSGSSLSIIPKFVEGGSYGDLYATDYEYDKNGRIKVVNGNPVFTANKDRFIGNATANFTFGWNNTFSYKDLSLYILIDGKIGGKVISYTESTYDQYGLSQRSADARNKNFRSYNADKSGFIPWDGTEANKVAVVILPDGTEVASKNYYETVGGQQFDNAYDATNVRIREVSLGYTFFDLFGYSKNLTLSLIGRNLGFIYKNSPVDPDISATAANGYGGIEVFSLPTTRSFGLNIKLTF